jgi:hypothetical protein
MRRPGDAARMAKMRARRAPFTDAREGRLKRKIRQAFRLYGKPLTTTELVKHCYWFVGEEIKSWHRANISRVANLLPFGSAARRAKGGRSCGHHGLN